MKIAVVTDSTACLPAGLRTSYDRLYVVPLGVTIEGNTFTETPDFDVSLVTQAQNEGQKVSTSRPSPEVFREVYQRALADGVQGIVSVHAARNLSSTLDSAQAAAQSVMDEDANGLEISVVDSQSIGMGLGLGVLAALTGSDVHDAAARARATSADSDVMIYANTLRHLHAGGRIGRASTFLGSALSIKPLLTVTEGLIVPVDRARSSAKALERLTKRTAEHVNRHQNERLQSPRGSGGSPFDMATADGPDDGGPDDTTFDVTGRDTAGVNLGRCDVVVAVHASWPNEAAESVVEQCAEIEGVGSARVWRVPLGGSVAAHIGAGAIATVVGCVSSCDVWGSGIS